MGRHERALYDLAEEHGGLFTISEATAAGIPSAIVGQLALRGRLTRLSRGVYRLNPYPRQENEQLHEAVLWPQTQRKLRYSVLSHSSALALYGISDASPSKVHITVPPRTRFARSVPNWLIIHRANIEPQEIRYENGIAVTSPVQSILDVAESHAGPAVVGDAVNDAYRLGLITKREFNQLNYQLRLRLDEPTNVTQNA